MKILYTLLFVFSVSVNLLLAQTWTMFDINTQKVPDPSSMPEHFVIYNGKMYFAADNELHGTELWVTDGTAAGTQMLKDIYAGTGNSNPENFIVFKNTLFFVATNGVAGYELWSSDGTANGTNLFKDIYPGSSDSKISDFNILRDSLFFGATNGVNGYELWSSDGTATGTTLFKDLVTGNTPGYGYSGISSIKFNNKILFLAITAANGEEPWITDGTTTGTFMLKDIYSGYNGSNSSLFYAVGDTVVYFRATTPANGRELYKTDGTIAGTYMVKDIRPGSISSAPKNFCFYNNKLFFRATDSAAGTELWTTDGTSAGTQLFMDLNPGSNGSDNGYTYPHEEDIYVFNGKMYFSAKINPYGDELFVSDGTISGTKMLAEIRPGTSGSSITYFIEYNKKLYFRANAAGHYKLWRTDGTSAGTELMECDSTTGYSPLNSTYEFVVYANSLWFRAIYANSSGNELWKFYSALPTNIKKNIRNNEFSVFPNPAENELSISNLEMNRYYYEIYDSRGYRVISGSSKAESNTHISISSIPSGVYFIRIITDAAILQKTFVKIR